MKPEKIIRALTPLLIIALLAAMAVPAVSAEEKKSDLLFVDSSEAIFEIIGTTTNVKTNVDSEKSVNILENKYGKLNIPSTVLRYDIVQFSKADVETDKTNSLNISIYGKTYNLVLEKMDFEDIDDRIDSYSGYIKGLENSIALLTFDESMNKSLVHGTIQLKDETIFITPIQNRENGMKTAMPLHAVYSSKDMIQPSTAEIAEIKKLPQIKMKLPDNSSPADVPILSDTSKSSRSWESVYVLIATDQEFYELETNWVSSAQSYISQAAYQYQRADLGVFLNVASYDDNETKRVALSGDSRKTSDPLCLFKDIYPVSDLNDANADIAIYLGGNDLTTGQYDQAQGLSWGYSYYNTIYEDYCRYLWSQMIADNVPVWGFIYDGSYKARVYCIIHELGHIFNATHEKACTFYDGGFKTTVMTPTYLGIIEQTYEYSSPSYHGDIAHNNAGAISAVKGNIASFV
ncbi:M12 family metallo-peptidase [Methanoplanus limicola]|uniref:Uncharacterized protein n=1 Tax=Methanoplanus limicola DSM 2279 TaxID=937775 RepID=H1YZZ5_9EURY|nr:M12 family metallo-peptidase [Methanoplanus limicola]EHQ35202.1 hypothetical protein Metlim_1088 [Methanoplanus limicola DSM 2279]